MNDAMLGLFGGISLPEGQPHLEAFESVRLPGDGAFDRIASLAQFLLDADAAIVDLDDRSASLLQNVVGMLRGVSVAFREAHDPASVIGMADPITALGLGFVAQASVPIRVGGERVGTLAVGSRTALEFGSRDVETLRRLADLVGEGLLLRQEPGARPF